jgi:hypothetical protein
MGHDSIHILLKLLSTIIHTNEFPLHSTSITNVIINIYY